jgi:hypothetical protein
MCENAHQRELSFALTVLVPGIDLLHLDGSSDSVASCKRTLPVVSSIGSGPCAARISCVRMIAKVQIGKVGKP